MACSFKENRHITGRFVEEFRLIIPMHRLFVAIRPPSAIRKALLSIMGGVEGARWQSNDLLHLTLRFIGEVDRHPADRKSDESGKSVAVRFDLGGGRIIKKKKNKTNKINNS